MTIKKAGERVIGRTEEIPQSDSRQTSKLQVSIGICAYNEEANIGKSLRALQSQKTEKVNINQIVVISSACSDNTEKIVESFQKSDPRIKLIKQSERKGKASAVNLFLQHANGSIYVLESADTIPSETAIECLCLPFFDEGVGITGGHPTPVDDASSFMGFATNLIWSLAHEVSLIEPKLGELIAFRNVASEIAEDTAVDEAWIEAMIRNKGFRIKYVPDAYVYNKGPGTVGDFVKQRRRIYAGHLHLRKTTGHQVSSMNSKRLLRLVFRLSERNPKAILWTAGVVMLEIYSRLLSTYDFYITRRNPYIWDIASSTKHVARDD